MSKYIAPDLQRTAFTCPHCSVLTSQFAAEVNREWAGTGPADRVMDAFSTTTCMDCGHDVIWIRHFDGYCNEWRFRMVYPQGSTYPVAHGDMPADIKADFDEAAAVCATSHRSACALLRLAIQNLCERHLGKSGGINKMIGQLVGDGLPPSIQQALDVVRVVGNEALHGGEMNIKDDPETAEALFKLVNMIIEDRIARPAQIASLYESLPKSKREGIENRDHG